MKSSKKTKTFKVKPCWDGNFHEIDCIENEEEYAFFKSEEDVRPSSCIWIKKEDAERLYKLFTG